MKISKYVLFLVIALFSIFECTKIDDSYKDVKTIKKGHRTVLEPIRFLNLKDYYRADIKINSDLFAISDECDSGWSKLWGVTFQYVHNNSYRFVIRNKDGLLRIGYYSYINGVSPQENTNLKGYFVKDFQIDDIITMELNFIDSAYYILSLFDYYETKAVPLPKGWKRPVIENKPYLKCFANQDIEIIFLNN